MALTFGGLKASIYKRGNERKTQLGHTVGKKKTEMKNRNQTIFSAMTVILLLPGAPSALEIRQELYEFQMHITQKTTCSTFVISEAQRTNRSPAQKLRLPTIHFELGSAILSPMAAQQLLASMKSREIDQHTPLVITGHSCELGSELSNLMLSRKRAVAVVNFLESEGFTVTTLQAKGETAPITTNTQDLHKNRRVEVSTR